MAAMLNAQSRPVLFQHAHVFDGMRDLGSEDVLIEAGVVKQMADSLPIPANTELVDSSGKTL